MRTWIPSTTLHRVLRMPSTARKTCGMDSLRLAESSRVRSNHWEAWVWAAFSDTVMAKRVRAQMRSQRMGLRLYAMALLPICLLSKGSSISFMLISRRTSVANFCADCATPERALSTRKSSLRV